MSDNMTQLCALGIVAVLAILFTGDPDIVDAIIFNLMNK